MSLPIFRASRLEMALLAQEAWEQPHEAVHSMLDARQAHSVWKASASNLRVAPWLKTARTTGHRVSMAACMLELQAGQERMSSRPPVAGAALYPTCAEKYLRCVSDAQDLQACIDGAWDKFETMRPTASLTEYIVSHIATQYFSWLLLRVSTCKLQPASVQW